MVILLLLWRAEGYHQSAVGHLSPFIHECRTYYLNSRIIIFTIRNTPLGAIYATVLASILTFAGVIHTSAVGWGQAQGMPFVIGYLLVATCLMYKYVMNKRENIGPVTE